MSAPGCRAAPGAPRVAWPLISSQLAASSGVPRAGEKANIKASEHSFPVIYLFQFHLGACFVGRFYLQSQAREKPGVFVWVWQSFGCTEIAFLQCWLKAVLICPCPPLQSIHTVGTMVYFCSSHQFCASPLWLHRGLLPCCGRRC